MDEKDLRKQLEELHAEIEKTGTVDDEGREMLRHLKADIQTLLERSEGESLEPHPSFVQTMLDSIEHFEVTHPTLTNVLNQVMSTLSNAGI